MQRRYVFFPRVRRGRERNLFSPLVTIRSFNRGANFASIFRRICVSRGIAKSRRTNVFYKSNSYQGNIFNRAKILLSPSSRFVESRFSSRFAKQKREIPRYFGLAHFARIRTDVSKIVVISIVLRILYTNARIRSCISIYRLLPISAYRVRIKNAPRCVRQISSNLCSNLRRDVKNKRSFECSTIISTGNLHVCFFRFIFSARTLNVVQVQILSLRFYVQILFLIYVALRLVFIFNKLK